jgi:hypothetical protein
MFSYREIWANEKRWKDFKIGFFTALSVLFFIISLLLSIKFLLP